MLDLKKLYQQLEEFRTYLCSQYSCGHFDCSVCMNCCYGEECAIETIQNAIQEELEKHKSK